MAANSLKPLKLVSRLAPVVGVIAIWMATRDPGTLRRSREIRIGMTLSEVEALMRPSQMVHYTRVDETGVIFGERDLLRAVKNWLGFNDPGVPIHEWPVRVRLDEDERVDRVQRPGEFTW